jgi:hypothetical protein
MQERQTSPSPAVNIYYVDHIPERFAVQQIASGDDVNIQLRDRLKQRPDARASAEEIDNEAFARPARREQSQLARPGTCVRLLDRQ